MPEGFTDEQLREAAHEAGISPVELRNALAERAGVPARVSTATPATLQGSVALAVPAAISAVRRHLEQATGRTGHAQGEGRWDLVDDDAGLTYRIHATDDGAAGSLVHVNVDAGAGRGALALAGAGTGAVSLTLLAIAWLFSLTTLGIVGVAVGIAGALFVAKNAVSLARAKQRAEAIAAGALGAAQDAPALALPDATPPTTPRAPTPPPLT